MIDDTGGKKTIPERIMIRRTTDEVEQKDRNDFNQSDISFN